MISPEAEAFRGSLRKLRESVPVGSPTVEQVRAATENVIYLATEPESVSFAHTEVCGVGGLWAEPAEAVTGNVLLYLHGGGYSAGSAQSHRRLAGHLARAARCR